MSSLQIGWFVNNIWILIFQVFAISSISLICLKLGEKSLNSWLCLLAVAMNLFVIKQITLFGMHVTATDAMAVGYLLGLVLIQEYYGTKSARRHVLISFICSFGFVLLSCGHLLYAPSPLDMAHPYFKAILSPMPRLFAASFISFLIIQMVDISIFQWLRKKFNGSWFTGRAGACLIISQILDTVIFSYAGLYKLIPNLWEVMLVSFIVKVIVIILSLPFARLSKNILQKGSDL